MTERRAPSNPFYRNQTPSASSQQPTSPPPSYSRPVPPPPSSGPVSYGSLSDLTKGKATAPPGGGGYAYTPDPSRQGYRNDYSSPTTSTGAGTDGGRRMPPPPGNYGVGIPAEPPRRNVGAGRTDTATPPPGVPAPAAGAATAGGAQTFSTRFAAAQTTAAGYIPNSVSATATSLGDRVKGGYDSLTTQQRREQVTAGAGKVAAGAAKLAGKAAWQLGKFASGTK